MISFKRLSELARTNRKRWIWIGLAAVPAIHFYYVQEMIAALIIFSVLFVVAATVVLIIFLLDRASQHVMTWAEAGVAWVLHWWLTRSKASSQAQSGPRLCRIVSERNN